MPPVPPALIFEVLWRWEFTLDFYSIFALPDGGMLWKHCLQIYV